MHYRSDVSILLVLPQFYASGVYDQPTCSSNKVNHAVLVAGYGTDEQGKDYWSVKNR